MIGRLGALVIRSLAVPAWCGLAACVAASDEPGSAGSYDGPHGTGQGKLGALFLELELAPDGTLAIEAQGRNRNAQATTRLTGSVAPWPVSCSLEIETPDGTSKVRLNGALWRLTPGEAKWTMNGTFSSDSSGGDEAFPGEWWARSNDWEWSSLGAPEGWTALALADDARAWAFRTTGAAYHTTDGGNSWNPVGVLGGEVFAVTLLDDTTLIASVQAEGGGSEVRRSRDEGENWTTVAASRGDGWIPVAAELRGAAEAWVTFQDPTDSTIHAPTRLRHTEDGGRSWSDVDGEFTRPAAVRFGDAERAWLVTTDRTLWFTEDRGSTWVPQTTPAGQPWLLVPAGTTGSAWLADTSDLYRTDDWGQTWIPTAPAADCNTVVDLFALDDQHAWTYGHRAGACATTDGGQSWTYAYAGGLDSLSEAWFEDLVFLDPLTGFATDAGPMGSQANLWSTTDGGSSWQRRGSVPTVGTQIAFVDPSTGWIASYEGLWRTEDGGDTWTRISSGDRFQVLRAHSSGEVWAASERGLFVTSHASRSWQVSDLQVPLDRLESVGSALWGVATLYPNRIIVSSENAGETWTVRDEPFLDIDFVDDRRGCALALGSDGQVELRRTSDAGDTWQADGVLGSVWPMASTALRCFEDAAYVAFWGEEDGIHRVANGTVTDLRTELVAEGQLTHESIGGPHPELVCIAGQPTSSEAPLGGVACSRDGGATWTQSLHPDDVVDHVVFNEDGLGFAFGEGRELLRWIPD